MRFKKRLLFKFVWMAVIAMTILSTIAFTASLGR